MPRSQYFDWVFKLVSYCVHKEELTASVCPASGPSSGLTGRPVAGRPLAHVHLAPLHLQAKQNKPIPQAHRSLVYSLEPVGSSDFGLAAFR